MDLPPTDVVFESRQASYLNNDILKFSIVVHSFFRIVVDQPSIFQLKLLRPRSLNHRPQEAYLGAI